MKVSNFSFNAFNHSIQGDKYELETNQNLAAHCLLFHGAGQADKERFSLLREHLIHSNIGSVSFDFIGHGATGGELKNSSLKQRESLTKQVIENQQIKQPLTILASSMSAYTAICLTQFYKVKKLILVVPAVYDKAAFDVPFDQKFSSIIRKKNSWKKSDAWGILRQFSGEILIISAENDEVIPHQIPQQILNSAQNAIYKKHHLIPNQGHSVFSDLHITQKHEFELMVQLIIKFIKRSSLSTEIARKQ